MHELILSTLQWTLSFFFTFEITQALYDQYLIAFPASVAMVGFTAPCLFVVMDEIKGVRNARSVYYFYQDQLVFLLGPLERTELISLLVLFLSLGAIAISRAVYIASETIFGIIPLFQGVATPVQVVLIFLLTAVLSPLFSFLYRHLVFILVSDRRLAKLKETYIDSVSAANRLGVKHSGFIVRSYCPQVRWDFTVHSQLPAFRTVRGVMPVTGPSVIMHLCPLKNVGRDRQRLFLRCIAKSMCWAGGVIALDLSLEVSLMSLVSISLALAVGNAVAALWWLLSADPLSKVYSQALPTYRTLARPAYKKSLKVN